MPRLLVFLLLTTPASAEIPWFKVKQDRGGVTYRIPQAGLLHDHVIVQVPPGFKAGESYCLLYYFHGTGGRPNPGYGAVSEDFVTIGMTYSQQKRFTGYDRFAEHHWEVCRGIGAEVQRALKVEFRRSYVGGFSKGGWMAFYHAAMAFEGLDGAIIGGAGKPGRWLNPPRTVSRPFDVLILIGESDPNYPTSQSAVPFFKKMGVRATYEEFLYQGHTWLPTPRLHNWMMVQAKRHQPAVVNRLCNEGLEEDYRAIMSEEDAWKRYVGLRMLTGDPRLPYADEELRGLIGTSGRSTRDLPELNERIRRLKHLQGLIEKEALYFNGKLPKIPSFDAFAEQYRKIHENLGPSDIGDRAVMSEFRARRLEDISGRQKKALGGIEEQEKLQKEFHELKTTEAFAPGRLSEKQKARLQQLEAELKSRKEGAVDATFSAMENPVGVRLEKKMQEVKGRWHRSRDAIRPLSGVAF